MRIACVYVTCASVPVCRLFGRRPTERPIDPSIHRVVLDVNVCERAYICVQVVRRSICAHVLSVIASIGVCLSAVDCASACVSNCVFVLCSDTGHWRACVCVCELCSTYEEFMNTQKQFNGKFIVFAN